MFDMCCSACFLSPRPDTRAARAYGQSHRRRRVADMLLPRGLDFHLSSPSLLFFKVSWTRLPRAAKNRDQRNKSDFHFSLLGLVRGFLLALLSVPSAKLPICDGQRHGVKANCHVQWAWQATRGGVLKSACRWRPHILVCREVCGFSLIRIARYLPPVLTSQFWISADLRAAMGFRFIFFVNFRQRFCNCYSTLRHFQGGTSVFQSDLPH